MLDKEIAPSSPKIRAAANNIISASVRRNDAYMSMTSFAGTQYENEAFYSFFIFKLMYYRQRHPDFLGNAEWCMLLKFQNMLLVISCAV